MSIHNKKKTNKHTHNTKIYKTNTQYQFYITTQYFSNITFSLTLLYCYIHPYHITRKFTLTLKKKEKKEKLQPLNISTSQKKKQSPSPKPFTHREEQFQPLEYFTPKKKGRDGITTEEDGKLIYTNKGKHSLFLTSR